MITRRAMFGLLAAPAIVRASSLMPVKMFEIDTLDTWRVWGFDQFGNGVTEVIRLPKGHSLPIMAETAYRVLSTTF